MIKLDPVKVIKHFQYNMASNFDYIGQSIQEWTK